MLYTGRESDIKEYFVANQNSDVFHKFLVYFTKEQVELRLNWNIAMLE